MSLSDSLEILERRCTDCTTALPPGALFCPHCGAPQSLTCAACGRAHAPNDLFCAGCGKPLHHATNAPAPATRADPEPSRADHAERRQITFLFCDLVDSTAIANGHDPEDFREIVRAYHNAAVRVVQDFGGHVAQYLGDGLLVYFGYPRAHEDAAARALHAAVGIVAALPYLNRQLGLVDGARLRVRIGVHTGVVVVGDVGAGGRFEQLAIGDAPNIAARLQSLAPPNGIVASGATRHVVRETMDWRDLGAPQLKGVSQPLHAFAIGTDASRAMSERDRAADLTPIVGRDFEADFLESAWKSARAGAGTVVMVSGEPGIGKSRLLGAARDMVSRDAGRTILFRCSPYHAASDLHPVIEWMEHSLPLSSEGAAESRLAKLKQALEETGGAHPNALGLLAGLLSIPLPEGSQLQRLTPQILKQRTQSALAAWLLSQAQRQPLLLAFEDLHWADPSTLSLIEELTRELGSMRVTLLVTFRPEFAPPWPAATRAVRLVLERLDAAGIAAMVRGLAGGRELPASVMRQIVANTDGVPLFVEEFSRTVLESGALVEQGNRWELRGDLLTGLIPESLRDSLAARLDRLGAGRTVARHAAVIGRRFETSLLMALCGLSAAQLQEGLGELQRAGLIYRVDPESSTEHYEFKHALVQAAAHESLLRRERQTLHARVAQEIEARQPEIAERQPELLAYHLTESQQWIAAAQRWCAAGQRSLARSANAEAITQLRNGLALMKHLHDEARESLELALLSTIGPALIATTGFGSVQVGEVYARAGVLCAQLQDRPEFFPSLWGSWVYHLVTGRLHAARGIAEQMRVLGDATGDSGMLVEAHWTLGNTNFWLGNLQLADQHLRRSTALYDPQRHAGNALLFGQDPAVAAECYRSWALLELGLPDQSLQALARAEALAQRRDHIFTFGWVAGFRGSIHFVRREPEPALAAARATLAYCTEHGHPFWAAAAMTVEGWARAQLGEREAGLARMREGMASYDLTGSNVVQPVWFAGLADLELQGDDLAAARAALDGGFAKVRETGERVAEIELWRLESAWQARQPEPDARAVRDCLDRALDLAEACGARTLGLRAAVAMHRLLRAGENAEALAASPLPALLASFTEGEDLRDVIAARAELARCGAA